MVAAATTLLVAGTVIAGVSPSRAEPGADPVQPPTGDQLTRMQQDDDVRDAASALDLYREEGYGKVAIDLTQRLVTVFWKGPPPEAVKAALGEHDNGVEVTLTDAPYSALDLLLAGEELFDAGRKDGGVRMQGVYPNDDLSGLVAEIQPAVLERLNATKSSSRGGGALESTLEKIAGVPVTYTEGLGVIGTTRNDDSPPWQGGGAMRYPARPGSFCSTGFAVVTGSGQGRLLSAAHCDSTGNLAVNDGTDAQQIAPGGASVDKRTNDIDSMIIDPPASPGTTGKIFGGAWNKAAGTAGYQYNVAGSGGVVEGDTGYCVGGAMSGEHCGKTVRQTSYQYDCPGNDTLTCFGFRFSGNAGVITTALGDSGGPIYVKRSDGRVGARGINSAAILGTEMTCPAGSVRWTVTRCFQTGIGVAINRVLDYWRANGHPGLEVEVG
ncbi:hypothetical protein [Pimelobacter simplex]|uniref:hypothetical protein n=1 Tax=Nocardioides simplex TaxID=2045 RepID=UPI003AAB5D1C